MWRTNRATVSTVLDESQFEFQFLQKFAFLVRHTSLPVGGKSNLGPQNVPLALEPILPKQEEDQGGNGHRTKKKTCCGSHEHYRLESSPRERAGGW